MPWNKFNVKELYELRIKPSTPVSVQSSRLCMTDQCSVYVPYIERNSYNQLDQCRVGKLHCLGVFFILTNFILEVRADF